MAIDLRASVTNGEIKAVTAMSKDARADLAARINSTDPFTIFDSVEGKEGRQIACPICGSGTGKKHTGISPKNENGVWLYNCFACGSFHGDLISVIADANHLSTHGNDFFETLAIAAKILNFPLSNQPEYKREFSTPTKNPARKKKSLVTAAEYSRLNESRKNLPAFVEKQGGKWRGLSLEILQRLNWGFLPNYKHPDNCFIFPAVIVPNDLNGILARQVNGKNKSNIKPSSTTTIFIPDADNFDLVIVEGAINGASILQAVPAPTFGIIASGGTTGNENVLAKLSQLQVKGKNFRVLIAYDNDSNQAGQKAAKKLLQVLIKAGFIACIVDITKTPDIDLNDVLSGDDGAEKLKAMVASALAEASKCFAENKTLDSEVPANVNSEDFDAEINSLEIELQEAEKELADFDAERDSAIESLREIEIFDKETVFSDSVLKAAAFAKIFNRQVFSQLKTAIQLFKKKHQESGVSLPDFNAAVSDFQRSILARRTELEIRRAKIKGQIKTLKFVAANDLLKGLCFPDGFIISPYGIERIDKNGQLKKVCQRPVLAKAKFQAVDEEITKLVLTFKSDCGLWKDSAPTPRAEIFDSRSLVKISNLDFPFTSRNSGEVIDFLDAFLAINERVLPITYTFKNFGWHEFKGEKFFLDPRRNTFIKSEGEQLKICCTSKSQFARALKSVGSLDKWRQVYSDVKKYPVARFTVAAAVAAPLLEILGERGFWIHTHTKTRSGKTTILKFATSAVGNPDGVIKNFNATVNGLQGVAAEYNGFSFPIDEWQAASEKLKSQVSNLIHNLIDGTARTKMNKDSTIRENENWLTIVLTNGETVILNDNAMGGEFTRVLNIAAPAPILPSEMCKEIHDTIKNNHGLIFPLFLDELQRRGKDDLREIYSDFVENFVETYSKPADEEEKSLQILPEYCRYISLVSVADFILSVVFGENEESAISAATDNAIEIFKTVPTVEEIDDAARAREMILGFIAKFAAHFEGLDGYELNHGRDAYGKKGVSEDPYFYITIDAVKTACKESEFDYQKLVKDLINDGFFVPAEKIETGYKKPRPSVVTRISGISARCYRIKKEIIVNDDDKKNR